MKRLLPLFCLFLACPLQAATWYVRPKTWTPAGVSDGRSYETAWDGVTSIVWGEGGVTAGDTLYYCGTFHRTGENTAGDRAIVHALASGSEGAPITLRGDYPGDPGWAIGALAITAWTTDNGNGTYTKSPWGSISKEACEYNPDTGTDNVLVPVYTLADLRSTDGSHYWPFKLIRTMEDVGGGEVQCNFNTVHDFTTGESVQVTGTTSYNGTYTITVVDADSFKFTHAWVGDEGWDQGPSYRDPRAQNNKFYYNPTGTPASPRTVFTNWLWAASTGAQSYITITNFKLYCGNPVVRVAAGGDWKHDLIVDNCIMKYAGTDCLANYYPCYNLTVSNNTMLEFTAGIYMNRNKISATEDTYASPHNITITNNYFDCGVAGYNMYWAPYRAPLNQDRGAIALQPGSNYLIADNYIKKAADYGIFLYRTWEGNTTTHNFRILRNWIEEIDDVDGACSYFGIGIGNGNFTDSGDKMTNMVIAYNVIKNCVRPEGPSWNYGIGLRLQAGQYTDPDTRPRVFGNLVMGCGTNIRLDKQSVDAEKYCAYMIYNNISYAPAAGGWHIRVDNTHPNDYSCLTLSHNCFYPDTDGDNNRFMFNPALEDDDEADYAAFIAAAIAASATVENNILSDPTFVNFAGGNYALAAGSPCIDTGKNLGEAYGNLFSPDSTWPQSVVLVDQDTYGQAWEIGPYAYVGPYPLEITSINGSVSGIPDNITYYAHGELVMLQAVPDGGYTFVGWSGDVSGSTNPTSVEMNEPKSVTALFAGAGDHVLNITDPVGGSVTKSPNKTSFSHGENVTLTAAASAGYTFSGWSGGASGTTNPITITMDADKSVTASFAANSYTLTVGGTNGSVVVAPQKASYSYGETVSLQAVPGTGYHFTGWSGSLSGSSNPASIVMNADKSVTAAFAVNTYTLTTSATNGSVVKSPQAASYTHGSTVSLQAVAAEGYEFVGWSGAVSGSANPVEIVMDSSKSVTAAFTVKTYTLTTSAANGSVVRSPDSATYVHGSTVSVQAVAAEGYHFTGWSGAISGSSNPVSLVMDASKSVTAAFAANTYTLSVSALNGTVTASPSQATYTHGQVVTLTAAPSAGYGFSSWSGDASGTVASTTVTMDANKSVTAAFVLNTYTLNISSANGTVTKSPNQATYTHGQTVTLTAVPATGYSFSSWSGDLSGTVASATITMDGNKSVAAGFTINSYTLNTSGANGSIAKNPDKSTYNHGETVTLQAVPAEGYNFVNWSGDLAGSANPATLVMDSNKTVAAAFATNTYTLQTNATNGSVTRTPDQASFTHGETVTLTAVPQTGYSFSSWSGDASGSTATVTITMNADKSVTAGFTANAYTLSVSASNGSVTVNPIRATYAHGEVVTLTAVPSVGYSFGSWSGDASGTATSTTVTMDSNKSVTAAFTLNTYTLSVTSANGTVTKNPSQAIYNHGDVVTLTAEPAEGYEFAGWSGDLTGTSNPATLTMTSNKSVTAHFTAVSNDNEAPVLFGFSPLADAIQVPLNSLVLLRITDSGDGVDANTVSIQVNDNVVYAGNVASASGVHGVCRRVGTPAHYVYAFQPVEDFDYDSTVAVTVNAADLAGNAMAEQSYSFRTQMRTFGSNHCASWGPDGLDKGKAATVCDAGRNVWVVWHAGDAGSRDIYISRLTSGVEQFSGPIQLTSNASEQCNPDIAIGPDGRLFVVWQDNRRGNWDIYLRTSADGVTWSSEAEVTDFSNDETNPVIAVDARSPSYAYIAWQDNRAGNQDIYVASSSTHFASKTVACVTSNVQDQIGPRIAVDGANGVYLVWTDFRNGAADVYGAASSSGPWTNVAVATGVGSQSAPDIAAELGGYSLHFVWVNRVDNQDDVFYGTSIGLPASPLAGINIIDDTSSADQRTPAIVTAGSGGTARVFAAWQDFRNAADGLDTDLYAAEIKDGSVTNLFVGDGWTRTNQTEPCIGVDLFGRPYVVWTDERNAKDEIYFAASTFVEPTPLDVRMVVGATGGTVGVASPTQLDDVSVVIPAGACAYDVTVSIARIWNLEPGLPADILPYEFGPSGLQFEAPVTITIPYAVADFPGDPPQPYWYDAMTGAMSQQGITNIQYVVLSSTLSALRFQTTHFTPYAVVGEVEEGVVPAGGSGGGGGGCSLSPAAAGASGALEYFVPFTMLALAMIGLRIKDKRRHSKPQ